MPRPYYKIRTTKGNNEDTNLPSLSVKKESLVSKSIPFPSLSVKKESLVSKSIPFPSLSVKKESLVSKSIPFPPLSAKRESFPKSPPKAPLKQTPIVRSKTRLLNRRETMPATNRLPTYLGSTQTKLGGVNHNQLAPQSANSDVKPGLRTDSFSKPSAEHKNKWKEVMLQMEHIGPYIRYRQDGQQRIGVLKGEDVSYLDMDGDSEYYDKWTTTMSHGNNFFSEAFAPDRWIMINNFRNDRSVPYYMSDVVTEEYLRISKKHDFFGKLPSKIIRHNICNSVTTDFLENNQGMNKVDFLKAFLKETPNGKSTNQICKAFGLIPYDITVDNNSVTIYVSPSNNIGD
jgi:hypothetical protein